LYLNNESAVFLIYKQQFTERLRDIVSKILLEKSEAKLIKPGLN
jgi:hypothetical protein